MTGREQTIKVLVTDDSAFMRNAVKSMLAKEKTIEVVGTARDGLEAVEKAKALQPDLITLDIEMPRMDGLTAIKPIKQVCKADILMFSSLTTESSHAALTALKKGATDVIAKDVSNGNLSAYRVEEDLLAKVREIVKSRRRSAFSSSTSRASSSASAMQLKPIDESISLKPMTFKAREFEILLIGSSTGGPPVLENILSSLPEKFPYPVVVAQHMPLLFTRTMTERLDRVCKMPVHHVEEKMTLKNSNIYILPGGQHGHLSKPKLAQIEINVSEHPTSELYKPSVNVLFATAATSTGGRSHGVVLTGMGEDGRKGAEKLTAAGGKIIAQNQETCVVYGMPRAVTENNLVVASLKPEDIIKSLQSIR